jgi:hypothetical protein
MNTLFGMRVFESPLIEPEANVKFDPAHKCTWATEAFRHEMNQKLKERFGTHEVAYMFNPRALGLGIDGGIVMNPRMIARLRTEFKATGAP